MKVFLAGVESYLYVLDNYLNERPFVLSSFYYADAELEKRLPYCGDFLLDSGAYTFMQNSKKRVVWEDYIERYAEFIKRNKVEKYFELDIDSVVGYEKVKEYRARLERLTGTQSIPVWHTNRGKAEFERMSAEYPYVAIGGLVGTGSAEYARKYWGYFPWFIQTAHQNKAKIHALGFTNLDGLRKFHFDSVDSTRWNCARFGRLEYFSEGTIKVYDWRKHHVRLKTSEAERIAIKNFGEWLKFQKYADIRL